MNLEELIRNTDSLTFLNSLKSALAELKDELSTIEETKEYQNQAVNRARKIIRRIDNQYRAIVKASQGQTNEPRDEDIDDGLEKLMEEYDD